MTPKLGHCGDTTTPNFKEISVLHRIVAYVVPYPIGTEIREPAMSTFPELVDLFMIVTVQLNLRQISRDPPALLTFETSIIIDQILMFDRFRFTASITYFLTAQRSG